MIKFSYRMLRWHFVELVNTATSLIGQHQSARFQTIFASRLSGHGYSEAGTGACVSADVNSCKSN